MIEINESKDGLWIFVASAAASLVVLAGLVQHIFA